MSAPQHTAAHYYHQPPQQPPHQQPPHQQQPVFAPPEVVFVPPPDAQRSPAHAVKEEVDRIVSQSAQGELSEEHRYFLAYNRGYNDAYVQGYYCGLNHNTQQQQPHQPHRPRFHHANSGGTYRGGFGGGAHGYHPRPYRGGRPYRGRGRGRGRFSNNSRHYHHQQPHENQHHESGQQEESEYTSRKRARVDHTADGDETQGGHIRRTPSGQEYTLYPDVVNTAGDDDAGEDDGRSEAGTEPSTA
jgi:hypothetical protein